MGYTNPKYPEMEVAVLTVGYPDHANERAKEGDIVAIRRSHHVIGQSEMHRFIWLRIEGEEENVLSQLGGRNMENETFNSVKGVTEGDVFDKRRYCIPLNKIAEVFPSFDINRARDSTDIYQPFMVVDEDTGEYLTPQGPLSISGLVFDKKIGDYL